MVATLHCLVDIYFFRVNTSVDTPDLVSLNNLASIIAIFYSVANLSLQFRLDQLLKIPDKLKFVANGRIFSD